MDSAALYKHILMMAKEDKNVLGFVLEGSRGKGAETKYSDYDVYIIVKNGMAKRYKKLFDVKRNDFDISVMDFDTFKTEAEFGGEWAWNRYSYAHIKAQIDKNGLIQKLVEEKSRIPKDKLRKYIEGTLDGYINFVYRSLKCLRDGKKVGFRLEAEREIPLFVDLLFALERKVSPYYKYLDWELRNYPIKSFPMSSNEIISSIMKISTTGDYKTQQRLLCVCHKVFGAMGYEKVFDGWTKEKIHWMETVKL